jgi:hypothetical protein
MMVEFRDFQSQVLAGINRYHSQSPCTNYADTSPARQRLLKHGYSHFKRLECFLCAYQTGLAAGVLKYYI